MTRRYRRCRPAGAVAAAGLGLGVLAGCGTGADQQDGADATADPDFTPFVGRTVTVSAEVERVLGPRAFTLTGPEAQLLVITQQAGADVNENNPVTVTGTVRRAFELPRVEDEFGFDYDDGQFAQYDREPYIVATAVETTGGAAGGAGEPTGTTTQQPTGTTTEQPTGTTEPPTPTS